MKDNNLLASVALFSELYNNENYTNVTDILGEFIKGVVVTENKWTVNSTELKHLLETIYDFNIPESVVRTTVKNRLKDIITIKDGHYVFDPKIKEDFNKINKAYSSIQDKQNRIIAQLVSFVETKEGVNISEHEKKILIENLNKYLLDNGVNDKYSKFISAFIIANQQTPDFTENLNLIKEGLILYQGIRYTSDINELGKWSSELTIFLSTEHLFNSLGYNGVLFKQIFDDFYNLVSEINASAKTKNGERLIQLKYLEETRDEIITFFQTAEYIFKGSATLDTTKPAMKSILEGCRSPSDIKAKKVKFEADLAKKGITLKEFKTSIYQYTDYVVDDEKVLAELKKLSESRGRIFDENLCRQFFKIFTKINYLRGGESKTKFEKIGSIFITGNRFALFLAHNSKVKFEDFDIPFAKDIDYITSKFWFKLKKGFNNRASVPKAFDIVTKAQIIISAQLNQTVFQEYHRLQNELKDGTLTIDQAKQLSFELRQKPNKPEEITIETIDSSLDFLTNDSYFEDLHREKEKKEMIFRETLKENEELQNEIKRRDEIERKKEKEKKEEARNLRKDIYLKANWKDYKRLQNGNLLYFLIVLSLTILPIIIGFILRINSDLNIWMTSLGNNQYYVWGILSGVFLIELFGRSYLFNKEKVKLGWLWLTTILRTKQMVIVKNNKLRDIEDEFDKQDRDE